MQLVFLLLLACAGGCAGNVIGIDFGSDTMKVAIVQPGAPLEVRALLLASPPHDLLADRMHRASPWPNSRLFLCNM